MAKFTFNLPDIGEGIAEAEIVAWHVSVGDMVEEDQQIADMMTDKATVEMESPVAGKIIEIAGEVGDTIAIGSMLVTIEVEGEIPDDVAEENAAAADAEPAPAPAPAPAPKDDEVEERIEVENPDASDADDAHEADPEPAPKQPVEKSAPAAAETKVLASPAVRKRAKDLGIDLAQVKPAEDGRIRHGDLDQFLAYSGGYSPATGPRSDETVKVIGMRRRIAQNMSASKRNIPHFTYVDEVDVTDLEAMRAQLNENRGDRPKLTILPLLITAICQSIPEFPMINATYDDEEGVVTRHGSVNMGMAAQTDAGLMVPVIKDAQSQNLWQLAREIGRLAEAARTGKAKSDEMQGGTLTVTSLGPLGGIATTPVINRPEVAIIGPNKIVERPMFVKGADGVERVEKRLLMNISISCDHRVVDGWDAASFIQALKKRLEAPATILAN
ncbi:branched-chain alpha-keto acid dehydrogenase subunit E2 [Citromicrobium sp. RCC1885]|uniref:dihydrolipoamide acetyltransferase family protein n=1 Tax=unclassified Citromicrobium TaxID=2630544 RepID=UPI0006C911A1|nr:MULTISPECIES: dihydrolipoamide acetyltransferase family protein [unclassified Citromicrobium]MAO03093.1 2-oxo acid dehydrogenase subunit E2 [Citromicrobium sp.]KPM12346.1 branched-chain alpha-keto acid dehydrogenase subunit E2 [Citromicrobium sp. WPS32]KPM25418.1 branched-chain alpha-keto acid dehydrogenase subunit E2 [Citromicrobium sp. RCC1885]KPM28660.1 branched-chain alpha-keto acid dehydrogenase subunit E2 [Citromicrobium sp. RCC1878]OAM09796.1 branched-chain alpha-keto acid dehydrogen|tara:strand:+ start:1018 stop:2343 length:1326 start_codon:yes stop_codon:yes gene_type:complete